MRWGLWAVFAPAVAAVLILWLLECRPPDTLPPRTVETPPPPSRTGFSEAARRYERGKNLVGQNDCGPALKELDEAIRLDPRLARAYYERGLAKQCLGRSQEGLLDYDRAIELDPKDPYAYYARGLHYAGEGRLDRAGGNLNALLSLNASQLADNLASFIHDREKAEGTLRIEKAPAQ